MEPTAEVTITVETTEDAMAVTPDAAMTSEASADETPADIVLLDPPVIVGEHVRCTELRADLDAFFSAVNRQPSATTESREDDSGE